jgi:hypothetical protein
LRPYPNSDCKYKHSPFNHKCSSIV